MNPGKSGRPINGTGYGCGAWQAATEVAPIRLRLLRRNLRKVTAVVKTKHFKLDLYDIESKRIFSSKMERYHSLWPCQIAEINI
jgi:hypothetical protein